MAHQALTRLPNGLETSVVVLTGETGTPASINGSIKVGSLTNPGIILNSTQDFANAAVLGVGSGVAINTYPIGTIANINAVVGVGINIDATNLNTPNQKPSINGLTLNFLGVSDDKFSGTINGISISSMGFGTNSIASTVSGISVGGLICHSSGSATVSNRSIVITLPLGSAAAGGTTTNYGLLITGNGNAAATANWALLSNSTAPSYLAGPLTIKPAVSTVPTNNGDMTFSATSNTQITVSLKGTDGTVRSVVLTLS